MRRLTLHSLGHTLGVGVFKAFLVPSFVFIYCHHFPLPPPGSNSSALTAHFQGLGDVYKVVLWAYRLDLCQWYCVINLSLALTFVISHYILNTYS